MIGDTLLFGRTPFVVVGVAPEGFAGVMPPAAFDLFVPMMMSGALQGGQPPDLTRDSPMGWGRLMGRMRPGATPVQVEAELSAITARLGRANSAADVLSVRGTIPEFHAGMVPNVLFVMAMVGLVLLVACSNVAGLLLARGAARRRELAIRLSLGAGRWTVVRQLFVESLLLAIPGGLFGLLLALWGAPLLRGLVGAPGGSRIAVDLSPDGRVLAFTAVLALGSGLLFGLPSAIRATRRDLTPALREAGPTPGRQSGRLGGAIVMAQVAFAVVLTLVAGMLVRPVLASLWADPGFAVEGVVDAHVALSSPSTDFPELLRRLEARPEVSSVETGTATLLGCCAPEAPVLLPGEAPPKDGTGRRVPFDLVSAGLLEMLKVPLLEGRSFDEHDRDGAPTVAVVNAAMARRLWPGRDPLGQRFRLGGAFQGREYEVVGVVANARYAANQEKGAPYLFLPLDQNREQAGRVGIYLRARTGDPDVLLPLIREEARAVDPMRVLRTE